VSDVIKRRNDIAQGDRWPGVVEGSPELRDPTLVRLKPGRVNFQARHAWRGLKRNCAHPTLGPGARTAQSYVIADLDGFSDSVMDLAAMTEQFGMMCMSSAPGEKVELRSRFDISERHVMSRAPDNAEPAPTA
jgi:hypothetical protein